MEEVLANREGISRATVAEALEQGTIAPPIREILEALRKKLGLSEQDAARVEASLAKS